MNKDGLKVLKNLIILGLLWGSVLLVIGFLFAKRNGYEVNDVIFIEGIMALIIGLLSAIGGRPMGLSLNGMGQNNSQYEARANMEVTKMENEKLGNRNVKFDFSLSNSSLLVSGVLLIILNYIV